MEKGFLMEFRTGRRRIALVAAGVTAALSLAACASTGGSDAASGDGKAKTVNLSLVAYSTPQAAYEKIIAAFQKTNGFFTSPAVRRFALENAAAPELPKGQTASEKRGRRFFEDAPPDPTDGFRPGLCAHCHSGPLLNQTNQFAQFFIQLPIPAGQRFISVGVSEINEGLNPVRKFIFNKGTADESILESPDPGRALITGVTAAQDPTLEHVNAFKISPLRGVRRTAPYFHDNSAKTLEDVAAHYALFFNIVTGGVINLSAHDQADIVAYMKLLD